MNAARLLQFPLQFGTPSWSPGQQEAYRRARVAEWQTLGT
jgi:hypothetical protein